ncbi:MAG TPA: Flp family type IVb pilin [Acetobacteraceae bacterium]
MLILPYIKLMNALYRDRRGVTAVEYAVIAGALVTVIGVAFTNLGTGIGTKLTGILAEITT